MHVDNMYGGPRLTLEAFLILLHLTHWSTVSKLNPGAHWYRLANLLCGSCLYLLSTRITSGLPQPRGIHGFWGSKPWSSGSSCFDTKCFDPLSHHLSFNVLLDHCFRGQLKTTFSTYSGKELDIFAIPLLFMPSSRSITKGCLFICSVLQAGVTLMAIFLPHSPHTGRTSMCQGAWLRHWVLLAMPTRPLSSTLSSSHLPLLSLFLLLWPLSWPLGRTLWSCCLHQ